MLVFALPDGVRNLVLLRFALPYDAVQVIQAALTGILGVGVVVAGCHLVDHRSLASIGLGPLRQNWRAIVTGAGLWLGFAAWSGSGPGRGAIGFHLAFQTVTQLLGADRLIIGVPAGYDRETAMIFCWFFPGHRRNDESGWNPPDPSGPDQSGAVRPADQSREKLTGQASGATASSASMIV
ncbi:MAG: hypothetical protein ACR2LI_06590 [Propionibacteriaceae bacterium]